MKGGHPTSDNVSTFFCHCEEPPLLRFAEQSDGGDGVMSKNERSKDVKE